MLSMKQKVVLVVLVSTLTAVLTAGLIRATVTYDVELVSTPDGAVVYAPAGHPFNISCQVVGGDASFVSAMKWLDPSGNDIGEGNPGIIKSANNLLYLTFSDPKSEDRGIYKCAVKYGDKYDLQYAVNIIFYDPAPEFEHDFENATYTEGDRVQLQCYALGETPMTYEWFDQSGNLIKESNSSISIFKSSNESLLVIYNVQLSDGGMYSCNANNSHGLSSKLFNVVVMPRSSDNDTSISFDVKVVNVSVTSVDFEITDTGSAAYVVVSYREKRSDKEERIQIQIRLDNLYTIDNLVPGGEYTFRFSVRTWGGNSNDTVWSRTFLVTMLPDRPELIIQRLEKGTLELQWHRKVDDIMRETIDKYEISYYTMSIRGGNDFIPSDCAITIQIPKCRGGSSYIISGLRTNAFYQVEVRAHTASGYGEPSKLKIYMPA